MTKKLLLINPNFKYFPGLLENLVNYRKLPLGLAYIASYIRKHSPQVDVKICDATLLNLTEENVLKYISNFKPDIIGISVHTPTIGFVRKLSLNIKRLFPDIFIVLGGPHVTALPFENLDIADSCVIGEGEKTFYEVVERLSKSSSLEGVKGITFKKDGQYLKTGPRDAISDLDELPFPARDLFPNCNYRHIYPYYLSNYFYNTIVTSRGCSFDCNFCMNELMWKRKVNYRSLDNVFAEIEELVKKHNTTLLFVNDDNFTDKPSRVIEFCQRKKKLFPKLKWICHCRADCLSQELLNEMKSAGCVEIQIGVESGDERILNNCNKRLKISTISNAFKLLKKAGINQWATFIIGNEGDSRESIEKTIEFAKKIDATYSSFLFLSPFPGTKCFDNFSKKGYIKTHDWSRYQFHTEPVFETELLSRALLKRLRKKAYRKFYLRPKMLSRYFFASITSMQWRIIFSNFILLLKLMLGL